MHAHSLILGLAVISTLLITCTAAAQGGPGLVLHVSRAGNDAWSGTLAEPNAEGTDGPFATLERARDRIREIKAAAGLPAGGILVEIAGGAYERAATFELGAEDSGTPDSPIVYRGRPGDEVRLLGGRVITGWQPVTDPAVLPRLDESARGNVWQADLKALGITDFGEMQAGQSWGASNPGLEVFFRDEPMTLSRWPNQGWITIPQVFGERPQDIRGTKGFMDGIFSYEDDRPARWVGEKDIMLHGYWFWDWADQRLKVQTIDTQQKRITLEPKPQHAYGFRKGMYYYAYNLLPELDRPGEWYLDRDSGILYFWPPSSLDEGEVMISVLPTLVKMTDVSHLTLNGLSFECTRGTAVSLSNVTGVRVERSIVRNTGAWGIGLSGRDSGVVGCDLYNLAEGGVSVSGGDRPTLTPAGLYVDNCHFYRFGRWNPICKPGVNVNGVGNRVTHNLFNDSPHMAIMWSGNDHLFEYNEFHSVVRESNDAGVMYAGYNPAMRGHMIRYNYFHHVYGFQSKGCNGVYLDDMFCSATIYGNIFYQVPRAAFIGGGHDNVVENNIFVDCKPALHVDARMMGWASGSIETMRKRLEEVPYTEEPWRSKYPQLLTYLEGNYAEPRGNIVARNVCWLGSFDSIEGKARPGVKLEDNLVGVDPLFVDAENLDFRLREDSPAWQIGFKPIPVEQIGLYEDANRVTWPVVTEVRYPDPAPAKTAVPEQPRPLFRVTRTEAAVTIDGELTAQEWAGLDPAKGILIAQGLEQEPVKPVSRAWISHDGANLLVAVDNEVDPARPLKLGDQWGRDDSVELAFRDSERKPGSPILILRGYPSGGFASSDEAGAPPDLVKRAAEGVQYGAKIVSPGRWTAEWKIPLTSLGLDPSESFRVAFSLTARKTAGPDWVLWRGTKAATWQADQGGILEFVP
ncbi:MAG: right-handed parallel beta-helix repeat-containing protein [Armatimonadetes bacterium]|nr:right-handed parallel beta-helix repeat-containing protein [Armatimonadota bacterium]